MKALIPDGVGSVLMSVAPEPSPGPDEALVAVEAFSLNRGETFQLEQPRPGWRPGKDIAGTIVRGAADGTGPRAGSRVVGHPPQAGWAELVAVPVRQLAELPDCVSSTVAASLPLAGLTALRLLRAMGPVSSRRVLITGASGGVGHFVVEFAAAQGATITALVGSLDRGERLRELGADNVVTDLDTTEGRFDVIIDSVGGQMLQRAWRRLTDDGLIIWMGQASLSAPTLDFFDWTGGSNATMRKFHYAEPAGNDAEDLATLVRLVVKGCLHPQIGQLQRWTETPEVIEHLIKRRVRGKAVMEVA